MKVCIIGQGYIGLPTAALFSSNNCEVVGVDISEEMIENLNKGIIHIEEPGISDIINKAIERNTYKASLIPENADAFIITVPTPYIAENYSCDLSYVITACEEIIPYLNSENTVIIESTIAPMSIDEVIKPIFEKAGFIIGEDLYLAHCPERVLPGKILDELVNNDRIVGGVTPKCSKKASEVYGQFVKGNLILTEAKTAELSKCMENTFRDVNIALANELTKICAEIGVNALDVIKMANKHPRVNLHSPGPGVGGHCLAIDPYFIYAKAPETAKIIKLARDTNKSMIHDPHINNPTFVSFEGAIEKSDLILVLCDHDEFKHLDYDLISESMEKPIIFDTKDIIKNVPNKIKLYNYGNLYQLS